MRALNYVDGGYLYKFSGEMWCTDWTCSRAFGRDDINLLSGGDTSEKVLIRGTLSARTVNSIQLDLDPKADWNVL